MIVNRRELYDLTVARTAANLARIFLAMTTEGASPVRGSVCLALVRREQIVIDNEQFSAPAASYETQLAVGCTHEKG